MSLLSWFPVKYLIALQHVVTIVYFVLSGWVCRGKDGFHSEAAQRPDVATVTAAVSEHHVLGGQWGGQKPSFSGETDADG